MLLAARRARRESRHHPHRPPAQKTRSDLLPGVVLGGRAIAREDGVEPFEDFVVKAERYRTLRILKLPGSSRPDDRAGDAVLVQQPGQRDAARLLADLLA